ncbi:MAG TPA: hypothetical protein VKV17_17745 [Bryobacteraceae bacterium]|nr:hypothetical protein [Bryobacteraceae bacterium]
MLRGTTQKLLADVLGRDDLFTGLHRIRRRAVLWGQSAALAVVPHAAVVVSETAILDSIREEPPPPNSPADENAAWSIFAGRGFPQDPPREEHNFGCRMAAALPVALKSADASDACWIESHKDGWLFLLPTGLKSGWLLCVGGQPESMLRESRLVPAQISEAGAAAAEFPSHPRASEPLAGPGWLSCGGAALSFDPLCGEGAGNAAREAILAAAVLRAACAGEDAHSLATHYSARLLAGFHKHLEICRQYYSTGHHGPWWDRQLVDLNRGLEWTSRQLANFQGFPYRLNGFTLRKL